jgi:hypothetical protein
MPDIYCHCCRKSTPHKIVMCRISAEPCSKWQALQRFISLLARGEHYYEMEQQVLCRVCNHATEVVEETYSEPNLL